jgi:hypothetical protein
MIDNTSIKKNDIDIDKTSMDTDIKLYKSFINNILAESIGERELCLFQHDLAQKYNIEAGGNAEDSTFLNYMDFYDKLVMRNGNIYYYDVEDIEGQYEDIADLLDGVDGDEIIEVGMMQECPTTQFCTQIYNEKEDEYITKCFDTRKEANEFLKKEKND